MFLFPNGVEIWWLLSILGSFFLVAETGLQGLHLDRYLTWIFPLFTIYILRGIFALAINLKIKYFLCCMFIVFQIFTYPFFLNNHTVTCAKTSTRIQAFLETRNKCISHSVVGVQAAKAAGMKCIAMLTTVGRTEEGKEKLAAAGADFFAKDFTEINLETLQEL